MTKKRQNTEEKYRVVMKALTTSTLQSSKQFTPEHMGRSRRRKAGGS